MVRLAPSRLAPALVLLGSALGQAPLVVATSPAHGEDGVVPGKVTEVRVTFDRAMRPDGYSFMGGGPSFPEVTGQPRWPDARTVVLPVRLSPDRIYSIGIGAARGNGFRAAEGGTPSVPAPLVFTTAHLPLDEDAAARGVARLGELLPGRYSHAATGGVDWGTRLEEFAPRLRGARSRLAFALTLQELVDAAGDPHVWQSLDGFDWAPPSRWREFRARAHPDRELGPNVDDRGLAREIERLGGELVGGGRGPASADLRGGVRYLMIPTWERGTDMGRLAAAALEGMGEVERLIIDVRGNGGGDELQARRVAGLFAAESTPYVRRRVLQADGTLAEPVTVSLEPVEGGPAALRTAEVAVLLGPGVLSSNEAFALMMRASGALLVGQPTLGSSGNPVAHGVVPGLRLHLPSWVSEDLEGRPFEWRGLEPDVRVEPARGAAARRRDPTLVKALELLLDR